MADKLERALLLAEMEYDYSPQNRWEKLSIPDQNNLVDICSTIRNLLATHRDAEWSVNLTGGNKIMSLAANQVFTEGNRKRFYYEISRPGEILGLHDNSIIPCNCPLNCSQFLACYGFKILPKSQMEKPADYFPIALRLASDPDGIRIRPEICKNRDEWKKLRDGKFRAMQGDIILKNPDLAVEFDRFRKSQESQANAGSRIISFEEGCLMGLIDKPTGDFLTGGWLEIFFYELLRTRLDDPQIRDVHRNAAIQSLPYDPVGKGVENELDVCFMHRQRFCALECKTGDQEHDPDADSLYKLEAVLHSFRALRFRAIFATTSPLIYDLKTGKIKESLQNRFDLYGCRILDRAKIKEIADKALEGTTEQLKELLLPD